MKNNAWLTGRDSKCSHCWSNIRCIVNQVLTMLGVVICNLSRCNQIAKVSSQKGFTSLFIWQFVKYTRWRWKVRFNTFLWLDQAFGWLYKMVNHENKITPDTFLLMLAPNRKFKSYYLNNRIKFHFYSSGIIELCAERLNKRNKQSIFVMH